MRLKSAMLVHPIRTPWTGNNLTESLIPRDGWEIAVLDGMMHIRKAGESHTIVSLSMLRWAEVDVPPAIVAPAFAPKVPFKIDEHPDAPKNMLRYNAIVTNDAPVQPKRRGRPPKKSV